MARNLLSKYVWLVDTLRRHGGLTLKQINEKWKESPLCDDGSEISRRTLYNYRQTISDLFKIDIECNTSTFEYRLGDTPADVDRITDWLMNSAAVSDVVAGARDVASRILIEDVPSARIHLATIINAMKQGRMIRFDYHSYTRPLPKTGILLSPYFLKIFRQRWYVTGPVHPDQKLRTYALDRMARAVITDRPFVVPDDFDPRQYTRDAYGIIFDEGVTHDVLLRVDARLAKYLRALPLHPSQREEINDGYSLMYLHVRTTDDFVQELLRLGPQVTVLRPAELRTRVMHALQATLANYDGHPAQADATYGKRGCE